MTIESTILSIAYLIASVLFIAGLKMLSHPASARSGNLVAAAGMGLAIVATIVLYRGSDGAHLSNLPLIFGGIIVGTAAGWLAAKRVQMTAMPQMVSLFNGMGGACAALISVREFAHFSDGTHIDAGYYISLMAGLVIGAVSFTGSVIAFLKLEGRMERPIRFNGQNVVNLGVLGLTVALCVVGLVQGELSPILFLVIVGLSVFYGVLFVVPIGGADMPVVISLLNSFTGVAAGFGGFMYQNQAMITGGILVGASGTLLTIMMCRAMNRSLSNVLFSAFGEQSGAGNSGSAAVGTVKEIGQSDLAVLLTYSRSLIIVPGYGLAVAQAQYVLRKLAQVLEGKGITVRYAVHPVAGRMPGHMNVLLAEANVPYEQLADIDQINPEFGDTDVVLVIGANDVVNPAARHDKSSPIYGMPILDADKARNVVILKRSMAKGYAGIENELFFYPQARMLFGDAKKSLEGLLDECQHA